VADVADVKPRAEAEARLVWASGIVTALAAVGLAIINAALPPGPRDYWGTSGHPFDAPEPNYLVVPWIAEFWSVLTVIPYAGGVSLYLGFKYRYAAQICFVYMLTTCMYSSALLSHSTLITPVQQATCGQVISNAIVSYMAWGGILGGPFARNAIRITIGFLGWMCCVGGILFFPFLLQPAGGLYTLFAVQTPVVFCAWMGTLLVRYKSRQRSFATPVERCGADVLAFSGGVLFTAMIASIIEVYWGFSHGVWHSLYGFPWMHITVHVLEQVGIYLYGFGAACLHHAVVEPRPGAVVWAFGCIPVLALDPGGKTEPKDAGC
jgi:hypothetical protein